MPAGNSGCMADEKACGSNECVKADYVCDGEPDCHDRSDEQVIFVKIKKNKNIHLELPNKTTL